MYEHIFTHKLSSGFCAAWPPLSFRLWGRPVVQDACPGAALSFAGRSPCSPLKLWRLTWCLWPQRWERPRCPLCLVPPQNTCRMFDRPQPHLRLLLEFWPATCFVFVLLTGCCPDSGQCRADIVPFQSAPAVFRHHSGTSKQPQKVVIMC